MYLDKNLEKHTHFVNNRVLQMVVGKEGNWGLFFCWVFQDSTLYNGIILTALMNIQARRGMFVL